MRVDNQYVSNGDGTTNLLITRKSGEVVSFLLNDASVDAVRGLHWTVSVENDQYLYAKASGRRGDGSRWRPRLHRVLAGAPKSMQVDHVSGDTLDNRLSNLRVATHAENQRNRKVSKNNCSGLKGVYRAAGERKYRAAIKFEGKQKQLGSFSTPEEAADAYDAAAEQLHGSFAKTNAHLQASA